MKRGSDPADVPDVGFISSKQTRRHQSRPLSEAIPPDRAPYSSQRREKRLSLQLDYSGSSSDDDERTNRAVESKRGGTFAVGLAARNKELKRDGGSDTDHEETCEYCAAEKVHCIHITSISLISCTGAPRWLVRRFSVPCSTAKPATSCCALPLEYVETQKRLTAQLNNLVTS